MEPPLAGSKPRLRLRLLGLTDLHANLYPYDYYRDCPDNSVGLSRAASLVAQARSEALNCLLFDNGDILQALRLGAANSLNQTGQQLVQRNLNIQPTLTIRPGFPVRVMVNRDLVMEPYKG